MKLKYTQVIDRVPRTVNKIECITASRNSLIDFTGGILNIQVNSHVFIGISVDQK